MIYKIVRSPREIEIGLYIELHEEHSNFPGHYYGKFLIGDGTGHPGDRKIVAGWWSLFTMDQLKQESPLKLVNSPKVQ